MDLIRLSADAPAAGDSAPVMELSPYAERLAEIETAPVIRKFVSNEIRMSGKVALNETALAYITARMPGRIDKLFVNYTGIAVKKGDHMAEVYSPDLLLAQQELLQSLRLAKTSPSGDEFAARTLNAVREKYRLWGFSEEQIREIIQKGAVSDHLTLTAPISGVVIEKNVREGQYFEKGEKLFAIADLNSVWVNLDAYETDLPWLRYGQEAEFTAEACPGKIFKGRIAFIQPVLDETTRAVKVRLTVANREGILKPGMFVRAVVRAEMDKDGKVINRGLAGKWISPMHPEIVRDGPGFCDICGMPLVPAESLGFGGGKEPSPPLVIPATAPLVTGKRAVVYVADPVKKGRYEGRETLLGPKAGDFYIVESGLKEGERVVVNGNFKIDSAFQIHGKPSMMSLLREESEKQDKASAKNPESPETAPFSEKTSAAYFAVQKALFGDSLAEAVRAAGPLDGRYLTKLAAAADLKTAREIFAVISARFLEDARKNPGGFQKPVYKFFCPMAFDGKGGFWLQDSERTDNPYFGAVMPHCGEREETVAAGAAK
jgi:Cu(I)/Ag(I) efflux system membrane fusion protein